MFTGLVETTAPLVALHETPAGRILHVWAPAIFDDVRAGDSIAVNGCCLTVTSLTDGLLAFDLLEETLRCTNLGSLTVGRRVNLERALAANARLGGHFVQGHVDCATAVIDREEKGADLGLAFALSEEFARYVIAKGSVAVNGVSLTVAELLDDAFRVWLIPTTREATNLGGLQVGDRVNVEFDQLAKYAERFLRF